MEVDSTTVVGVVKVDTPTATKPTEASIPSPADAAAAAAAATTVGTLKQEIQAVARKFADQPLQNPEPGVWAVLTAISKNARQRPQGINILLSANEHCLGRCVQDTRFQISSIAVSGNHCRIFRGRVETTDDNSDPDVPLPVFLQDTSTNGTYVNWRRIRKRDPDPKARLKHGDIIAFAARPHEDNSYAFVYREVHNSTLLANGAALKRKSDEFTAESKRLKGIGIGAPNGPVLLDDVRSLQRSNSELRQQLEEYVLTIKNLHNESRTSIAQHENELKEMKEKVSSSFLDQIKELQCTLLEKQKEIDVLHASSVDLNNSVKDLKERLSVSMQSRVDADEIIQSQKATISELEVQLEEERNQRREEREKAAADRISAVQRAQLEAQEEIKRLKDNQLRQHKEQQEVISKLQETEKESRLLVEMLRLKLEDARESLVMSEKKVRQLEAQIKDEQLASANSKKKSEALEAELIRMKKELESEKVAREEAWAKVSALELEIAGAIRDLSIERQRFQGARERIILRETQLRAFYSTTEEISALFAKQQEQLKAMQRTLEDEEQYENASVGIDLNEPACGNLNLNGRDVLWGNNKEFHGASTLKSDQDLSDSSNNNDDDSTTEKHNCDMASQDGNTQDLECFSADKLEKHSHSNLDGMGTAVVPDADPVGTDVDHTDTERVPIDTEQVLETESPAGDAGYEERNSALHKCSNLVGDTMQLDDDVQAENVEPNANIECGKTAGCSQSAQDKDTHTIRTADLLASEVAGSWAVSTAPSVHGENDSPRSMADAGCGDTASALLLLGSDGQAAGSQSNAVGGVTKLTKEQRMLNAMIEIVAPEFKRQFQGEVGGEGKNDSVSDAETEGSNSTDSDNHEADTYDANLAAGDDGGDDGGNDGNNNDTNAMEDDDEMIEDSIS